MESISILYPKIQGACGPRIDVQCTGHHCPAHQIMSFEPSLTQYQASFPILVNCRGVYRCLADIPNGDHPVRLHSSSEFFVPSQAW